MNHLDLFSGIGGFSLAAQWVWGEEHKIVGFCEKDKFCQKVLKKHWPNVPIYLDIKELKGDQFEAVDLITGGFPCQPFSIAGKRKGKEDNRHLWPEMFRIIQETNPSWVVGENGAGIINLELEQACADLESKGYKVQPFVIPACAVNAPHRRDRVWIIAHAESRKAHTTEQKGFYAEPCSQNTNATHSIYKGLQGDEQQYALIETKRTSRSITECPWNENWLEVATSLCRVDARIPFELDFIGGLNEYYSSKKSESEIRNIERQVLRDMWKYRELAKTSPNLFSGRLYNIVPDMPYKETHGEWYLGKGIETDKFLCDLWERFYAEGQPPTQDLQSELLEYLRKIKQCQKKENKQRTHRLKSLGNAIVPQVAMILMQGIKAAE